MSPIEFGFDELDALAALIAGLNRNGVPFTLRKDAHAIQITVGRGY